MKKFITCIAILSLVIGDPTFVYSTNEYFRSTNDILYYDESAGGIEQCRDGGTGALVGGENLEKIYNYMLVKGLSPVEAAAAVGNVDQESRGDPTIIQGGGHTNDPSKVTSGGWGIIQWTPGSKIIGLLGQAKITTPPHELSTQLDLLWWHMTDISPTGVRNMQAGYNFKQETQLLAAVTYFHDKIEGSADKTMDNRYAKAKTALQKYGTSAPVGVGEPSSGNQCAGAEMGNVIQTALNYAWPEYHAPNYTKLKAPYAAAVKKAQSEGRFVGGGQYPGVDCGGFVTLVMQDSGVDPDYNSGKVSPVGGVSKQLAYVIKSGKYQEVSPKDSGDLKPGDIALKGGEHTYMYVGKNEGFETTIASASYSGQSGTNWRAPMAGHERPADPDYRWFRLTGAAQE